MYIKKKFRKNSEAVSPVVATLILVLVAVASATAFYLWQTNWQTGQTDKIDDAQPASTIDVAGSTTVYELAAVGADGFMREHPLYKVNVLGGGSSVGVSALLDKSADMGMVSSVSKLDEAKGKNADVRGYTLGYDAVTGIAGTSALTAHKIVAADWKMNKTIARALYYGYPFGTGANVMNWGQLAGIMNGTINIDTTGTPSVPTYTITDTAAITLVDRSDSSGTEAYWVELLTGVKDKQLQETSGAGLVAKTTTGANGNTGVVATVAGNANAIGFASWGVASKDAGIAIPSWVYGSGATKVTFAQTYDNLINQVGKSDNIRPLIVMTIGPAQGLAKDFIDYMLDETNNKELCAEVNYLSLYK